MEQASYRLMVALQNRGHACSVLSINPLGKLTPMLAKAAIEADGMTYRGKGGWRSFLQLRQRLRTISADALLMTGHNFLAAAAIGDRWRGRRVLALHYHHAGVKPLWQWRLIYAQACGKFASITYPSEFILREAESIFPQVRKRGIVVRNPVTLPPPATPEDQINAREVLGIPQKRQVVGNAGWLISRKRWDIFLEVAARVSKRNPDVLFVVAGDGPERSALETLARNLGIEDRLLWLGWVEDMAPFYRSLDILLFHSDWDALGLTPVEAMSYEIPVVASVSNGGLKEVMKDGIGGVLLSSHDIPLLAEAVGEYLERPMIGKKAASLGRQYVAQHCDPACVAQMYEHLLRGHKP